MQMNQMNKVIRKQIKGINKQVRQVNKGLHKGLDRNLNNLGNNFGHIGQKRSTGGFGIFTGLLLLSIPVVAGVLLLGKNGAKNREKVSQLFTTENLNATTEKLTATTEPILGKIQTQFTSFVDKLGFGQPQQAEQPVAQKNGKGETETQAAAGNIQSMGEV